VERRPWRPLHWAVAGILLGVLNAVMMNVSVFNRPIGASTSLPWLAGRLLGWMDTAYLKMIAVPGRWETWFLAGAVLGSFVSSLLAGDFRLRLLPARWKQTKGDGRGKRVLWVVVGSFLLILGARLAGGCTSGHMLSGGMQLAVSSLVFAAFATASLLITGRLFYRR